MFQTHGVGIPGLALAACATLLIGMGANSAPAQAPKAAPAPTVASEPGNFAKVAQKLQEGGTFYLIWDLGGAIRGALNSAEKLVQASGAPQAALGFPVARSVVKTLGLENLGYLGISHGRDAKNRDRQTAFLQVEERIGLFTLNGEPRNLDLLAYFPQNSSVAVVSAVEFSKVIPLVESIAESALGAMGTKQVSDGLERAKEKEGVDFRALLGSAGNEIGLVAWLDEGETMRIDARRGPGLELPRPHLAMLLNTSSDAIFRLIAKQSAKANRPTPVTEWEGWEMLVAPESRDVPGIAPVLAWRDGLTVAAESTSTLRMLLATKKAGNDVRTGAEWKSLSEGLPTELLKVLYISPSTTRSVADVMDKIPATNSRDRTSKRVLQQILKMFGAGVLMVTTYQDGGFLSICVTEK